MLTEVRIRPAMCVVAVVLIGCRDVDINESRLANLSNSTARTNLGMINVTIASLPRSFGLDRVRDTWSRHSRHDGWQPLSE